MSTARRVTFEYPPDLDVMWTPQTPEFACAANAVSLLMPSIEPYFVKSIRAAATNLSPERYDDVETYLFQEAQHHKQHVIFNTMLLERYPKLQPLERFMKRVFGWLSDTRTIDFNVAFAACAETVAYSAARWAADRRHELFTGTDDVAATLFLWHLAEEVEHKSSAFDVYLAGLASSNLTESIQSDRLVSTEERVNSRPVQRSFGEVFRYLTVMICALAVIIPFIFAGTAVLLTYERRLFWPVSWFRLFRWSVMFAFEALTNLGMSLFPSHHPTDFTDPIWFQVWLAEFDAQTETVPIWNKSASSDTSGPLSIPT